MSWFTVVVSTQQLASTRPMVTGARPRRSARPKRESGSSVLNLIISEVIATPGRNSATVSSSAPLHPASSQPITVTTITPGAGATCTRA